jgi:cytochrome P450
VRVRLDLASARLRADDGSHLGWLGGELGPVLPCVRPAGALVLSAGLAREVLSRPARYSSAAMAGADGRLLGADGPAHRRLRQGVVRCVRGAAGEPVAQRARGLVAAFAAGGGGDAVALVARPLSHAVAAEVTGLPVTVASGLSG